MSGRRFGRDRQGRVHPRLRPAEHDVLEVVARQVQEVLAADDPSTTRLFPVAYPADAEAEAEYRAMLGTALRDRHQHALDTLAVTASADTVDEAELHQWMGALEVARLVLGTQLDVHEDMTEIDPLDPRAGQFALYAYLSVLQGEIVDALAAALPKVPDEDDR